MWFARLFGFGKNRATRRRSAARVAGPQRSPASRRTSPPHPESRQAREQGFDPYNTGCFERRDAWERVGRR